MNDDRLKMESELLLLKSRSTALLACLFSSVLQVVSQGMLVRLNYFQSWFTYCIFTDSNYHILIVLLHKYRQSYTHCPR